MKPLLDVVLALFWLAVSATVAISAILLVWLQGYHLPFYIVPRVGRDGRVFRMTELGSTIVYADRSGVDSTSVNGRRNTPVGHFVRRYKLDELTEFWNVLTGDMSLVGPRPNVKRETDLYSCKEKKLSKVQSGITDFSSIVFSDEGDILEDKSDPDLAYNE